MIQSGSLLNSGGIVRRTLEECWKIVGSALEERWKCVGTTLGDLLLSNGEPQKCRMAKS